MASSRDHCPTGIEADFAVTAEDDSMIDAKIQAGDSVLIRRQSSVNDGQIAAVCIGDQIMLRRVYYHPEKQVIVLAAANPKYEPIVYTGEDCA